MRLTPIVSMLALAAAVFGVAARPARAQLYQVHDLGTLGGENGCAADMNDVGGLVGASKTATGETHAFVWLDGELTDLGTLGGDESRAAGINGHGIIVGSALVKVGAQGGVEAVRRLAAELARGAHS